MANIIIRAPLNTTEIEYCVDMYLGISDHNFTPLDREYSIKMLSMLVRRNEFVRLLLEDSKILAWIYGKEIASLHSPVPTFNQNYYCSDQKGLIAAKCVKLLHATLVDEAKRRNIKYVLSQGSHMDEKNVLTRLLEKQGWIRRGHIALYKID